VTFFENAVVLAAGQGRRMQPYSGKTPKQLLTGPSGQTMLNQQINWAQQLANQVHVTVGYEKNKVSEEALNSGASSVTIVDDLGNAAWITKSSLGEIRDPTLVVTCDNLMRINKTDLLADYQDSGHPICMLIPVHPAIPSSGDLIEAEKGTVTSLRRIVGTKNIASGLQILQPEKIQKIAKNKFNFTEIWELLIEMGSLKVGKIAPTEWIAVDQPEDLHLLETWDKKQASKITND
tara:strand:- start:355 stop:1059 length:705 start_codon:yes stop_codon:yes gene_type:complete